MKSKYPSGSQVFDNLLNGGYDKGVITTIFGPAGSGKSNLVLLAVACSEKKVIYVDPEGSFSYERLSQLHPKIDKLLERVILLKPTSFTQQHEIISKLPDMMSSDVELVVVDSIAYQYRVQLAHGKDVNQQLSSQMQILYHIASEYNIPVLITSQVYSSVDQKGVNVVGGDIIKYASKCMIELQNDGVRKAIITKHRSLPDGKFAYFFIDNVGIYEKKDA